MRLLRPLAMFCSDDSGRSFGLRAGEGAQFILGDLGEGLPFDLTRLNDHTLNAARNRGLKKEPKAYIRENLVMTTSGNFCQSALRCTIEMLGIDSVMFSVDWPYESNKVGARSFRMLP